MAALALAAALLLLAAACGHERSARLLCHLLNLAAWIALDLPLVALTRARS